VRVQAQCYQSTWHLLLGPQVPGQWGPGCWGQEALFYHCLFMSRLLLVSFSGFSKEVV